MTKVAIMCVVGIKFSFKNGFADYCSPEKTGAIKGIFVFIVVLSHARSYFPTLEAPQGAFYREFLNFFRSTDGSRIPYVFRLRGVAGNKE